MQTVALISKSTGALLGNHIGCAHTSLTRLVGLLGRQDLDAGEGIWILPSSGVHTFGMRFPIDVVGLDRGLRIVKLWRCVQPNRLTSVSLQVSSVLELAAGQIEAHALQIGHELSVQRYPSQPAAAPIRSYLMSPVR